MGRAVKLVLGTTTIMAIGGRICWQINKVIKATLIHNKRDIRNFIRFNLNNNRRFLAVVEQLSPSETRYLAALIAKTCQENITSGYCLSEFQQAIHSQGVTR